VMYYFTVSSSITIGVYCLFGDASIWKCPVQSS